METSTKFANIGIVEFKRAIGAETISVVQNPKTKKLFVSASNGQNYKAQATLDITKPMVFLVSDGEIESACLVNQLESNALVVL